MHLKTANVHHAITNRYEYEYKYEYDIINLVGQVKDAPVKC